MFQGFSRSKAQPGAGGNLDLFAGSWVTTHARLELALAEYPESRQTEQTLFLELLDHQLIELVERGLCQSFADTDLVGQMGRHLRLCHPPPPKSLSILNNMNDRSAKFKIGLASTAP